MMAWMEMDYNMDFENVTTWTFFKYSSSARKSLKFGRNIVAIQNSFKKLLSVIYLEFIKFVFDKFSRYFLHL